MPQPEIPKELINQALELEKLVKQLEEIQGIPASSIFKKEFGPTLDSLINAVNNCKVVIENLEDKTSEELNIELDKVLKDLKNVISTTDTEDNQ